MPIRPEQRALYPKDWPAISLKARERAGWKCQHQGCGARQYSFGCWHKDGSRFVWGPVHDDADTPTTYSEARQAAAEYDGDEGLGPKPIVIVLTVAHLNHDPTDCRPENLAAMCQRHHLAYDHALHRANSQATRRARGGTAEMF